MSSGRDTPEVQTTCTCVGFGERSEEHASHCAVLRTADDPFGCCGGNDEKPPFHCSDCPTHPWTDEPSPLCMTAPTACPHARASASASVGARVHALKCWPFPFHDMKSGAKRFEYRKNDRDFRVGDCLVLQEYEPTKDVFTKECFSVRVTYVLPGGTFGVPPDYCVLGVEPWEQRSASAAPRCICPRLYDDKKCPEHALAQAPAADVSAADPALLLLADGWENRAAGRWTHPDVEPGVWHSLDAAVRANRGRRSSKALAKRVLPGK